MFFPRHKHRGAERDRKLIRKQLIENCNVDTPYAIRDGARKDLFDGFESNEAKKTKNPQHRYQMHFRRKKAPHEAIVIPKTVCRIC